MFPPPVSFTSVLDFLEGRFRWLFILRRTWVGRTWLLGGKISRGDGYMWGLKERTWQMFYSSDCRDLGTSKGEVTRF